MTLSISKLETIDTSQTWKRTGVRVDIGGSVATFEEECDAEDAVNAMDSIDDVIEIIKAAKRWCKATKALSASRQSAPNGGSNELDESQVALIVLIDKVRE